MARLCLAAVLLVGCAARSHPVWNPEETHAVIVGVLDWQADLASYKKKNRKDRELKEVLVRRGVPEKNI